MNRREMLQESFRSIARALPAALGAADKLAGMINHDDNSARQRQASCFPVRRTEPATDEARTSTAQEE
jgi:hypothetical protein